MAKRTIFGDSVVPEEFTLGLADPQTEIRVWLVGPGTLQDVTFHHSTVCVDPFTVCVALAEEAQPLSTTGLVLRFSERCGGQRALGEIALRHMTRLPGEGIVFHFFQPLRVSNFCLPRATRYAHLLRHLYVQAKSKARAQSITMSFLDRRAAQVSFIRPHPTVLVSVQGTAGPNIFPMNLMGQLGESHFGFALRVDRWPAKVLAGTRHLAISNVPLQQAALAYSYAGNHTVEAISLDELPFRVRSSPLLDLPVPEFAQRVREFEVVSVQTMGSHAFFIARILEDEGISNAPTLSVIHGYYQLWRLRQRRESTAASLAEDRFHKHGAQQA